MKLIAFPRPFIPVITTTGYHGCVDVFEGSGNPVLGFDNHFFAYYIDSTVQKGFSGTCLLSVSAIDVFFFSF